MHGKRVLQITCGGFCIVKDLLSNNKVEILNLKQFFQEPTRVQKILVSDWLIGCLLVLVGSCKFTKW